MAYKRHKRRNTKRRRPRRFKKRAGKTSLTLRKLTGLPDQISVRLPYTFNYNVITAPDGLVTGGDVLLAFAGNSYPNIAGLNALYAGFTAECPTNWFFYGSRFNKCTITGAKLDCTVSYGGTFGNYDQGTPGTWYPPIDGLLMESPTLCCIAAPYDTSNDSNSLAENAGGFIWDGVTSGQPRPSAGATYSNNWSTIANVNLEEMMSMPNVQIRRLTSPIGSKTMAHFKSYQSVKKFTGVKDFGDNQDLAFTVPEGPTASITNTGEDLLPQRGFAWMIKSFVPNGASNTDGAGSVYQVSGRITYYCRFNGLRPAQQADWVLA